MAKSIGTLIIQIPQGDAYESFKRAAFEDGRKQYFTVTSPALVKKYEISKLPAIVFFRNFEEPRVRLSNFTLCVWVFMYAMLNVVSLLAKPMVVREFRC